MEVLTAMGIHREYHQQTILSFQVNILGKIVSSARYPAGKLNSIAVKRAELLEIATDYKMFRIPGAFRRKSLGKGRGHGADVIGHRLQLTFFTDLRIPRGNLQIVGAEMVKAKSLHCLIHDGIRGPEDCISCGRHRLQPVSSQQSRGRESKNACALMDRIGDGNMNPEDWMLVVEPENI